MRPHSGSTENDVQAIQLNIGDYAIIFGYFALIVVIGLRLRRRMVSSSEYFRQGALSQRS